MSRQSASALALGLWTAAALAGTTREVLEAAGIRGGLVVVLGCEDIELVTGFQAEDGFVVHALDPHRAHVDAARKALQALGSYGKVSADVWDGKHLPYIDNLVNLVVIRDDACPAQDAELMRVLAPRGVVIDARHGGYDIRRKPVPGGIDEWTHFLHGADNNALARDTVVGPPHHMQWLADPRWTRHHHHDKGTQPTVRAVVSAGGRLFYMVDEATAANIAVPSRWVLAARDAFSGVLLWKKPLKATVFQRRLEQVWRTLVTDGERVYAPLGQGEPLSAVDAVSGKTIQTYPGTEDAAEIVLDAGRLFIATANQQVIAVNASAGERLWVRKAGKKNPLVPLTLAASEGKVWLRTDEGVDCIAAGDGTELWRFVPEEPRPRTRLKFPREVLIASDGVVLVSYGGNAPLLMKDKWDYLGSHPPVRDYGGTLAALSADDGRLLWKTAYRPGLESGPGEVYVSDGRVWQGPDFTESREVRTGKILTSRPVLDNLWTTGHHYRCYPGKATSRYIITAKRGVEMFDLAGDSHVRDNWVRGTCRVGVLPCNGLLYAPPHSCGCYMEAKLTGFWALAATRGTRLATVTTRIEKGTAFGSVSDSPSRQAEAAVWPTYRGDNMRSGSTAVRVPTGLHHAWVTALGGRLSAATAASGNVFVAQVDAHTVHALDSASGKRIWQFTAGGRVDSPPTYHRGLLLFGSADGYVYCLRASDGVLVWRFLAAPARLNSVAHDQVESLWPVHGSVLVDHGIAYAVAGRSSYLDDGICLYGLEPFTGQVLYTNRVVSRQAEVVPPPSQAQRQALDARISQNSTDWKTFLAPDRSDAFSMAGARSDLLVADAGSIFMRTLRFDAKLVGQDSPLPHLFATGNLLDGSENHRSHWVFGTADFSRTPVAYSWIAYAAGRHGKDLDVPYGLMLAVGKDTVWGVHRAHLMRSVYKQKGAYRLFARTRTDLSDGVKSLPDFRTRRPDAPSPYVWTVELPLRPRALVRAGDTLVIGGMSDTFNAKDADDAANAVFAGQKDGLLNLVSASDGTMLTQLPLPSPPVWDGIAVANGCVFIPMQDGRFGCYRGN